MNIQIHPKRTLYEVLDVPYNAPKVDIINAYNNLYLIYKDKTDPIDKKTLEEIKFAGDVLLDDEKRRYYNLGGEEALENLKKGYSRTITASSVGFVFLIVLFIFWLILNDD